MIRECGFCGTALSTVYVTARPDLFWCVGCVCEHIAAFRVLWPDAVLVLGHCKYHLQSTDDEEEPWLERVSA